MNLTKYMAEQATGIHESVSGLRSFSDDDGNDITDAEARILFCDGKGVHNIYAGAGSYDEVFSRLGFDEVKAVDTTATCGDWTFAISDDDFWYLAYQRNRYPRYGFCYTSEPAWFGTLQNLYDYMETL